jgi:hypothetical protein
VVPQVADSKRVAKLRRGVGENELFKWKTRQAMYV